MVNRCYPCITVGRYTPWFIRQVAPLSSVYVYMYILFIYPLGDFVKNHYHACLKHSLRVAFINGLALKV